MKTIMRYITIKECMIHRDIAEKYDIKGYSSPASIVCSLEPKQFKIKAGRSKEVTTAKKRAVKKK